MKGCYSIISLQKEISNLITPKFPNECNSLEKLEGILKKLLNF